MPVAVAAVAGGIGALIVLAHGVLRVRSAEAIGGRDLWILTTALVWFGGIVLTDGDLAFTATNVVLHGVPYLALVAWVQRREAVQAGRSWGGVWRFALPLVGLAMLEEGLWDALVWHDHEGYFGAWDPPSWAAAVAVVVLAVPQITHYLLDGHIWRLGPGQERLRAILGPDKG